MSSMPMQQTRSPIAVGAPSPVSSPLPLILADARADDHARIVRLSPDRVTIDRRYQGVSMRLSVPVEAYEGISVGIRAAETGGVVYELRLSHRDADLSVSLTETPNDDRVWADWRHWAQFFGLPTLIERNEGLVEWGHGAGRALPAAVAPPVFRRRSKRRRAAFMNRRYAAPSIAGAIHREAEIIARD